MTKVDGNCAWVIGAAGGIGSAVTEEFGGRFRYLHLCDRVPPNVPVFDRMHSVVTSHVFDMSSHEESIRFASLATSQSGPPDVLVIAAGEVSSAAVETIDECGFDSIVRNNLALVVFSLQAFYESCDRGRNTQKLAIVIGSNAAEEARPGQPIYAATKAAIRSLVASLSVAWGDSGFSIVGVEPGTVVVERNRARVLTKYPRAPIAEDRPSGLLAVPADIASFVGMLLTHGRQLTGRAIVLDGGSTLGGRR